MTRPVILTLVLVAAGFAMAAGYFLLQPHESRLAPFSDREYVARAERTDEARAFLAKYPDAARSVDRSSAVVVEFRAERGGHALRLEVLLDSFANRPLDVAIRCDAGEPRADVREYLRSETCLGS